MNKILTKPKFSLGLDFKNLPPSKSVLINKIERSNYLARMIKYSHANTISTPEIGWLKNELGELEIDYFTGNPYPESITDIVPEDNSDTEDELQFSSEDEENSDENSIDDDWN